jgi:hypothetical protein
MISENLIPMKRQHRGSRFFPGVLVFLPVAVRPVLHVLRTPAGSIADFHFSPGSEMWL